MKNVIEIHTDGKDPEPRSALDELCVGSKGGAVVREVLALSVSRVSPFAPV